MIYDKTDIINGNANEAGLEAALDRLDKLAGLNTVKKEIREFANLLKVEMLRNNDSSVSSIGSYYIFTGNPGTGKITVARILADIFKSMGLLSKGHLVMKDRSGLVGEYIGETAHKTNAVIDEAMGGILFIDDANSLVPEGAGRNFDYEAIDTLLKRIEDDMGKFVVIFSGYKEEMNQFLINNPGIRSRFRYIYNFEDMNPDELADVFTGLAESNKLIITPEFRIKLKSVLTAMHNNNKTLNNARDVRYLFDEARKKQANRVAVMGITDSTNPVLFTFEPVDLVRTNNSNDNANEAALEVALDRLDKLAGLNNVKKNIKDLVTSLKFMKDDITRTEPLMFRDHFIFTGNPGTGKTTVARILADIIKYSGFIPSGHIIETDKKSMVGQYIGETAVMTNGLIDSALGGVFYIDEAYALLPDDFGHEAVNTLLKRMEDDMGKFVVIFSGYKEEINQFLIKIPGLRSRARFIYDFEDMKPEELADVFTGLAELEEMIMAPEFRIKLKSVLTAMHNNKKTLNNARTVRNLFDEARKKQVNRVAALGITDSKNPVLFTFEAEDLV